jgi:hypothetical protein
MIKQQLATVENRFVQAEIPAPHDAESVPLSATR